MGKKKITTTSSDQHVVPDLTDLMNDVFFFGTVNNSNKSNNAAAAGGDRRDRTDEEGRDRESGSSGRMTQEWLEEARRMVAAASPSRCDSPSRLVGSPRFAAASPSALDRRDPLSRSARRHRAVESFSGEIISKSANHSRNRSETFVITDTPDDSSIDLSPAEAVHKWFSNILKPTNPTPPAPKPIPQPSTNTLSRRQSFQRKTRFQSTDRPQGIPAPPGRSSEGPNLFSDPHLLSPPRSLVESAHRRSISSSTCSVEKIIAPKKPNSNAPPQSDIGLDGFLKRQRTKLSDGCAKARIVLSGPSNSTSSMVAAICYAWLLENRNRTEKKKNGEEKEEEENVVVPVMNMKRETMWKLKEASWLFYHVNLDVSSLLYVDEVDLEGLMMDGKLSMIVIGQDVLRNNGEVRSQCTILTDNYCEEAYDLLQTPMLKKLLLAAILLDTENLNSSAQLSMTRDAEAVQLLLVGSAPNYRNTLFDQLTQVQRDEEFLKAMRQSYGKPPIHGGYEIEDYADHKARERKSASISHHEAIRQNSEKNINSKSTRVNKISPKLDKPSSMIPQGHSALQAKVTPTLDTARGKNKFSLAKWFGFGSK